MKAKTMRYISRDTHSNRWRVRIERLEGIARASFADSDYGGKLGSKRAAKEWRDVALTEFTNKNPPHEFKTVEQYIYDRVRFRGNCLSQHIEVRCQRLRLLECFCYHDNLSRQVAIENAQHLKRVYGLYNE